MNEQRQLDHTNEGLRPRAEGDDATGSEGKLAETRAELSQFFAAADSILDAIRLGDNERFLEQARQSGGE